LTPVNIAFTSRSGLQTSVLHPVSNGTLMVLEFVWLKSRTGQSLQNLFGPKNYKKKP
jgi:hypothetical protein